MSNYWIGDAAGRVLGPLTLQALRDLIGSGRMKKVNRASRDGTTWVPIESFDEVKDLLAKAAPSPAADQENAERIRTQLRLLQGRKTPHEVFGMLPTANLDELRLAFFRMAKRFSPEHLGPETHPELRRASQEMFDFLSAEDARGGGGRASAPGHPGPRDDSRADPRDDPGARARPPARLDRAVPAGLGHRHAGAQAGGLAQLHQRRVRRPHAAHHE